MPVPRIIQEVPPEAGIDGAILMEYLPGTRLNLTDFTDALAYEMGSLLAYIHHNRVTGYGDLTKPQDLSTDPHLDRFSRSWNEWHQEDILFLDTNLPEEVIEYAIQMGRMKNLMICVDPVSVSKSEKLPVCLDNVFLIKPDRLEAEALTGTSIYSLSDCIKAGQLLLDKGVKHCIITLGQEGYVIINQFMQQHFPALSTKSILDVSGAGDAFIAGILYKLKQGLSITKACQMGATLAAMTLQSYNTVNENISISTLKLFQDETNILT